jgi:uncharacterized protein with FMN-binding domain
MPRRGLIAVVLTTFALVLLLNFKTPDAPAISRTDLGTGSRAGQARPPLSALAPSPRAPGSSGTGAGPQSPSPSPAGASGRITGPVIDTRYGPVQLEATISAGRIVDVQALQLPTDRALSARISQYVEPILRKEALQVQSPQIDVVSGATYTSEGYAESLQAILDQANQ